MKVNNYPKYPENVAELVWEKYGIVFSIVKTDGYDLPDDFSKFTMIKDHLDYLSKGHYNGYCRFPKRLVKEPKYSGIITYVPVHGGITYAQEDPDDHSMVYGFDCGHSEDHEKPELLDLAWLKTECERMAVGIAVASKHESNYLSTHKTRKATAIQKYHDELKNYGINFDLSDNFGAMINVLIPNLEED